MNKKSGGSVITSKNAIDFGRLIIEVIKKFPKKEELENVEEEDDFLSEAEEYEESEAYETEDI